MFYHVYLISHKNSGQTFMSIFNINCSFETLLWGSFKHGGNHRQALSFNRLNIKDYWQFYKVKDCHFSVCNMKNFYICWKRTDDHFLHFQTFKYCVFFPQNKTYFNFQFKWYKFKNLENTILPDYKYYLVKAQYQISKDHDK